MVKRSTKFYRKNEAEVMQALGLRPTINSGAGWVEKEDGANDDVLCQLKSTDARSIRIDKKDIEALEIHAAQSGKAPVFAVQFLRDGSLYLLMRPGFLGQIARGLALEEVRQVKAECKDILDALTEASNEVAKISDDPGDPDEAAEARACFYRDREEAYSSHKKSRKKW